MNLYFPVKKYHSFLTPFTREETSRKPCSDNPNIHPSVRPSVMFYFCATITRIGRIQFMSDRYEEGGISLHANRGLTFFSCIKVVCLRVFKTNSGLETKNAGLKWKLQLLRMTQVLSRDEIWNQDWQGNWAATFNGHHYLPIFWPDFVAALWSKWGWSSIQIEVQILASHTYEREGLRRPIKQSDKQDHKQHIV